MIADFLCQLAQNNYAPSTIALYETILQNFSNHITKKELIQYQQRILRLAPVTRRGRLCVLKKYLSVYYPDLVAAIVFPKQPALLPQNIPSQAEVRKILHVPKTRTFEGIRDRAILELFYSTGLRRMELINLKTADLDFVKHIIRINQGKNRKDRLLPIAPPALAWVGKYLFKIRPLLKPKSDFLFLSRTGHQMNRTTPNQILAKYSAFSCHKFRHAFATHLLQNGMKETSLQRLLGHAQIDTTQRYTQVTILDLKKSYAKFHLRDRWDNKYSHRDTEKEQR